MPRSLSTPWSFFGWTLKKRKCLQPGIKSAQKINSSQLSSLEGIYRTNCSSKAMNLCKDFTHPGHRFIHSPAAWQALRCLYVCTSMPRNSFYPKAVTLMNTLPLFPSPTSPSNWTGTQMHTDLHTCTLSHIVIHSTMFASRHGNQATPSNVTVCLFFFKYHCTYSA